MLDGVLVRLFMPLDAGADFSLLLAPLGDAPTIEGFLDLSIQLVQVDLPDPVLQLGVASIQLLDGAAVELRPT